MNANSKLKLQLDQVDADLPGLVEVAEHAHGVETVEEVDDHEDEDSDPKALACFCLMAVEELHQGSKQKYMKTVMIVAKPRLVKKLV